MNEAAVPLIVGAFKEHRAYTYWCVGAQPVALEIGAPRRIFLKSKDA